MSKGNLNTSGGKKNNFSWQQSLLLINGAIRAATTAGATEATLQLVLTALQNGQDYEAKLVTDSDTPSVTWLEVRLFNHTTGTFDPPIYYLAGSNAVGSPVLPVTYIDPTTLLSTIANNTTGTTRTHNYTLANAAGTVPAGTLRGSVINEGNAVGSWNGSNIPAGISVPWGGGNNNDTYNAINYDATGTTFIIEYTT